MVQLKMRFDCNEIIYNFAFKIILFVKLEGKVFHNRRLSENSQSMIESVNTSSNQLKDNQNSEESYSAVSIASSSGRTKEPEYSHKQNQQLSTLMTTLTPSTQSRVFLSRKAKASRKSDLPTLVNEDRYDPFDFQLSTRSRTKLNTKIGQNVASNQIDSIFSILVRRNFNLSYYEIIHPLISGAEFYKQKEQVQKAIYDILQRSIKSTEKTNKGKQTSL